MATSEQAPAPSQQQQQQQRVRKPPFADWPTIKILTPPQGRFSPKFDEWCFTSCSQTISGRIHGREPNCRSICIRQVFPHEVRNILSFKRHQSVGADGKAKYPLPYEGQSANLPRILGGSSKDDPDHSQQDTPASGSTKFWDEGWYLWTGKGRWASQQKAEQMMLDIPHQQRLDKMRESRKEIWQDYQEQLKNVGENDLTKPASTWWGPLVPPKTIADAGSPSILIPLPPDVPSLWQKIHKLLKPSHQLLSILQESITSGEQKQFAYRVWEKAGSEEPFVLAQRTVSNAYAQWKKRDEPGEDEEKKGST
ncbi:hypothetical protein CPB83DRAFT_857578 [Crepidotus variabilis]|uniref:Uncharacterized protein n=1 Tax=Crepidotus variabilis TaxID=179855 RepID=A0A9P6JNG8_9AGAR|nr:hypothetical protein CPB83DRAFT_857578 [Crepidotus variabilis]